MEQQEGPTPSFSEGYMSLLQKTGFRQGSRGPPGLPEEEQGAAQDEQASPSGMEQQETEEDRAAAGRCSAGTHGRGLGRAR